LQKLSSCKGYADEEEKEGDFQASMKDFPIYRYRFSHSILVGTILEDFSKDSRDIGKLYSFL
jgi:hypothetical protein